MIITVFSGGSAVTDDGIPERAQALGERIRAEILETSRSHDLGTKARG